MTNQTDISTAAAALGRKGGKTTSEAKAAAARANGAKGGRPPQLARWFDPVTGEYLHHRAPRFKDGKPLDNLTSTFDGAVRARYLSDCVVIRRGEALVTDGRGVPLLFADARAAKAAPAWSAGDVAVRIAKLPKKLEI